MCPRDWSVRARVERHRLWPVPAAVRRCEWVSSVLTDAADMWAQQFVIPHTVPRVPSWLTWNGVPALQGVTGQGAALANTWLRCVQETVQQLTRVVLSHRVVWGPGKQSLRIMTSVDCGRDGSSVVLLSCMETVRCLCVAGSSGFRCSVRRCFVLSSTFRRRQSALPVACHRPSSGWRYAGLEGRCAWETGLG